MERTIVIFAMLFGFTFASPTYAQPKPAAPHEPYLQFYPVPDGSADILSILLQDAFPIPMARIASWGKDRIVVWAGAPTHQAMAKQKALAPSAPLITEALSLESHDIGKLTDMLRAAFRLPNGRGPFIGMDESRNLLIVRGTAEQNREVRDFLTTVGEKVGNPNLRVMPIENGGALPAAQAVQLLIPQVREKLRVKIVTLDHDEKTPPPQTKPAKDEMVVHLTAINNTLIVASENPEAMATVVRMINLLQKTDGSGHVEVIRLKHAKANHVAKLLDEILNDTPGGKRAERVRVLADPETNSLLCRARPLDMLVLRNLVAKSLDIDMKTPAPK